jgi:hypothetical protein
MYIEGTGFYTFKECHKTESFHNHTATVHKERERLGDRRNVGESSCNSGDGTGQMAQPVMFMMMINPFSCAIRGGFYRYTVDNIVIINLRNNGIVFFSEDLCMDSKL